MDDRKDKPADERHYRFACNDSLGEGAKTNERDSTEYNRLLEEEARKAPGVLWGHDGNVPSVGRRDSRSDTSKAFWVVTGVTLVTLAVGALWLENRSQSDVNNKPKIEYHSPANQAYSPTSPALTPHEAYLKDGTSYRFYIIDNKVAVTELGGKPVVDSLEGKLGK